MKESGPCVDLGGVQTPTRSQVNSRGWCARLLSFASFQQSGNKSTVQDLVIAHRPIDTAKRSAQAVVRVGPWPWAGDTGSSGASFFVNQRFSDTAKIDPLTKAVSPEFADTRRGRIFLIQS